MPGMTIETISETSCFGGTMGFYRHRSDANDCDMQFSVFVPPQAANGKVPVLTFLSGLTCTEGRICLQGHRCDMVASEAELIDTTAGQVTLCASTLVTVSRGRTLSGVRWLNPA